MGISITPNDDSSYTVQCGTEELTFIPTRTSAVRTGSGNAGSGNDRVNDTGGQRHRPIDTGGQRHRAAICVPFGISPDWDGILGGTIQIDDSTDLTRQIQDALQLPRISSWESEGQLMLNVPSGTTVDIGKLLFSADEAAATQGLDHLDIMLTGDFFKK